MSDYLMRDGAPFGDEGWSKIDEMVVRVLKKVMVGRRFIPMVGPLGWGVEVAPVAGFTSEDGIPVVSGNEYKPLKTKAAKFMLRAKQLAAAEASPFGVDLGAVAMAATELAKAEDAVLIGGLLKVAAEGELGDWSKMNGPFSAVSAALAALRAKGVDGPYALVMSPGQYAKLVSLAHGQGMRREIDMVEKLATAGVFQYAGMDDDQVLIVSAQPWNLDFVVGQDAVTAYLGNEGLDHVFQIMETLLLRVKRPEAVLLLK